MRYYTSEMLIQIFIIAVILGWLLRELGQAGKEIWQIAVECMEVPKLQKTRNPLKVYRLSEFLKHLFTEDNPLLAPIIR